MIIIFEEFIDLLIDYLINCASLKYGMFSRSVLNGNLTHHCSLILSNSSSPFPHLSHLKLNSKSPFKTDGGPDFKHSEKKHIYSYKQYSDKIMLERERERESEKE